MTERKAITRTELPNDDTATVLAEALAGRRLSRRAARQQGLMTRHTVLHDLHNVADVERVRAEIEWRHVIQSADLERCRLCGAPATVELFTGYWLCRPCSDRLGREAMKLGGG